MRDPFPPIPAWTHHSGMPWHRIQGIDWSLLGAPRLYLALNEDASRDAAQSSQGLCPDDWMGAGTLRNSFFVAPWSQLTSVRQLGLWVEAQGRFRLKVLHAVAGGRPEVLREVLVDLPQRGQQWIALDGLAGLPSESRLFWHIDALETCRIHQLCWCTPERPAEVRMAVLMRTLGRTADLQAQLQRFLTAAQADRHHEAVLAACDFWVLDASPEAATLWETPLPGLRLQVLQGPNLGGGGNCSLLMHSWLAADAERDEASRATDVLILDDDAILSMETLARHVALCRYRREPHIATLPVLQRSQPTRVWEDGGFWGRLNLQQAQGRLAGRRNLSPHLIKHGLSLQGFEHLDSFAALNRCEYATFIFFGMPAGLVRQLGLPAALFLRGDDIEYSLRAQALGIPVISHPQLAAWHEPGHGYAQEYMAILHGVLVNFRHSTGGADELAAWFSQRLVEHALIGDTDGLRLYLQVMDSLLDTQGSVLTPAFAEHYLQLLPQLQAPGFSAVPVSEQGGLRQAAQARGMRILPYLYPGLHPSPVDGGPTLLHNPSQGSFRELPEPDWAQVLAVHRQALERLEALVRSHDALRAFWCERLQHSGEPRFWAQVRAEVGERLVHLRRQTWQAQSVARSPIAEGDEQPSSVSPLAHLPVRELRQRMELQLNDLARLRQQQRRRTPSATVRAGPVARAARWPHQLWHWWRGRVTAPARAERDALPPDFDPQGYLALNADVARTGMDPVQHYLRYGQSEGRRYRAG